MAGKHVPPGAVVKSEKVWRYGNNVDRDSIKQGVSKFVTQVEMWARHCLGKVLTPDQFSDVAEHTWVWSTWREYAEKMALYSKDDYFFRWWMDQFVANVRCAVWNCVYLNLRKGTYGKNDKDVEAKAAAVATEFVSRYM